MGGKALLREQHLIGAGDKHLRRALKGKWELTKGRHKSCVHVTYKQKFIQQTFASRSKLLATYFLFPRHSLQVD